MWPFASVGRAGLVLVGFPAWAALPTASLSASAGSFGDWLQHLEFGVPGLNVSLDALQGVGELEFSEGSCTHLTVGGVDVGDYSDGPALSLNINISGLGARCSLQSAAPLVADVVLADSWISASLAVMPFEVLEDKFLPVAVMMSQCATRLHVASSHFAGAADMVARLEPDKTMFSEALKASVDGLLCEKLPDLVNNDGSRVLNLVSGIASELLLPPPLPPLPQALTTLVDWGTYPPILLGKAMLAERLAKWRAGGRVEGAFLWDIGALLVETQNLSIRVGSVEVAGLQTLGEPALNLTGSNGTIEAAASASHLSVSLSTEIEVAPLQQGSLRLAQPVNLTVDIRNLSLVAEVIAMLSKPAFDALGVAELQMPGCLLQCARNSTDPPSESLGVRELELDMTALALLLRAPRSLEQNLAVAVNRVLGALLRGYLPSLLAVLNGLLSFQIPALVDDAWRYLEDTSLPCNGTEGTEGVVQQSTLRGLWGTGLCILAAGLLLGSVASWLPCSLGSGKGSDAAKATQKADNVVCSESNSTADPENGTFSSSQVSERSSVLATSGVPRALAIFYPFVVFAVIFLFLFADLALGTSVDLFIEAGEEVVRFGSLFAFSLIGTIRSTWAAEAYAISVLTLLFSGLWPLLKLVLLLVTWLAPLDRMSVRMRGLLLSFLDVWGKFSFLDSWFLVLCMSAFSMQWRGGGAAVYVRTQPTVAYFAFLLATMLSLVLGNVASSYHGHAQKAATVDNSTETAEVSLQRTAPAQRQRCSVRIAIALLLPLAAVVTVLGAAVPSFRFSMSGLGADLIYEVHQHTEDYSLISVGMAVSASNSGNVGLVLLQMVFLFLCVVVPVLTFLALLVLWAAPLDTQWQEGLLHACQVLDAWATLDVFVLTVAVGHAEFGRLASRLLAAGSLAPLCGLVQEKLGDACFELDLELLPGFGLLLVAGVLSLAVPKAMPRFCRPAPAAKFKPTSELEQPQPEGRSTSASGGQAFEDNFTRETSSSSGPDAPAPNRFTE